MNCLSVPKSLASASPTFTGSQRDTLLTAKLRDSDTFRDEIDRVQGSKRRPGTVAQGNGALLIGTGLLGVVVSGATLPFTGPVAVVGLVTSGVQTFVGAAGLVPRGPARPASLRKHAFAELEVVGTRVQSAEIVSQLGRELHVTTPGRERYVLSGWDPQCLSALTVGGQPVSQVQRQAIQAVLERTEQQQHILRGNFSGDVKKLKQSAKHPWNFATLSRDYRTVLETGFMKWRLKRDAASQVNKP